MTAVQKVEKTKSKVAKEDPAELVREVRAGLGLSQLDLGRILGVHDQTIWRWEKGRFSPTVFQKALLLVCREALRSPAAAVVKNQVATALQEEDAMAPARAVYAVLHAQFGSQ